MTATQMFADPAPVESRLLENKVAIVTGASRGIGAVAARAFAAAGAAVLLAARSTSDLQDVAAGIMAGGGDALAVPTDVGDEAAAERLVQRALGTFGRLDAAFNNAGQTHTPTPLAALAIADFDAALRVNARGIFLMMRYQIPAMLAGGGGAIVNMSSTAGLSGAPGMAGYAAAKHAIIGLTETAALDYGEQGIRVNAIAPGPILTRGLQRADDAVRWRLGGSLPLHRLGQPEEVAATAAWLCSDQASFITGATIPIDGGKLAGFAAL
ncbi:MAG TPA: glucose 1-dehydrogenase [Streptosporangiaceae bacterium]|nr:glucose 1-dehydrogenase [Streptosporangiaceae bacterium]